MEINCPLIHSQSLSLVLYKRELTSKTAKYIYFFPIIPIPRQLPRPRPNSSLLK